MKTIQAIITHDDYDELVKASNNRGMTLSTFVKQLIIKELKRLRRANK